MNIPQYILYPIFFLFATLFSFLINGLFLKFSHTLGIRNQDDTIIRWGSQSKPAVGGISFYIVFLISISLYPIFFGDNELIINKQSFGIIIASSLGFIIGLADDAYNTKPFLKFIGQFLCGIILILTGTYINISGNMNINYALTIFWVIGMMNSINMLDNMDAITATVAVFIMSAAITGIIISGEHSNKYTFIIIGVIGAVVGFLFLNWHPSKIYMGDTGSQFMGVFLAALGILFFWNAPSFNDDIDQTRQIINVALIFALPIIDTTTVTINRLLKGKSPFVGGKDHTTHNLSYLGLSDRKVALVFSGISIISLALYIYSNSIIKWTMFHFGMYTLYGLTLFILLYYPTRIKRNPK